jgi:hypothetical protein
MLSSCVWGNKLQFLPKRPLSLKSEDKFVNFLLVFVPDCSNWQKRSLGAPGYSDPQIFRNFTSAPFFECQLYQLDLKHMNNSEVE